MAPPHPITRTVKIATFGFFLALMLTASGCNSKVKPTPENFTTALDAWFGEHPDCLISNLRFPYETSDPAETKQLNSLVKAQLLEVHQESSIHVSRFTVSTTGTRYAPRFCYGHRTVTSIDSSTPPTPVNGFPQTQVTYRYTMQDVPIWAKTPEVMAAYPRLANALSGQASDHSALAQTMAGWQVPE